MNSISAREAFDGLVPLSTLTHLLPNYDARFFSRLVERLGRPVVELGIGTGRLAEEVRPDFGVDFSGASLEKATSRSPETQLILSDLKEYQLPVKARFSYAGGCTFDTVVSDRDIQAILMNTREQTERFGHLAFDAFLDSDFIRRSSQFVVCEASDDEYVVQTTRVLIDADRTIYSVRHILESLDEDGRVADRRYLPQYLARIRGASEFRVLLEGAHWRVDDCWGGYAGEPLDSASRRQVWLAQREE